MDNILIAFINLGPYHLARIKSAYNSLKKTSYQLHVIELTNNSLEHSWGEVDRSFSKNIYTLELVRENLFSSQMKDISHPKVDIDKLNKYLNKIKPKLIFLPGWSFEISKLISNWAKANRVKIALMSETKSDDKRRNIIIEFYKRYFLIPKYSAAIVGGSSHSTYLESLGMKKELIYFGYDVVDNDFFKENSYKAKLNKKNILNNFNLENKKFFIGAFRLINRKNTKRLIESYQIYFNKYGSDSWPLVICGDGCEFEFLNELVNYLKLEKKVIFLGFVDYLAVSQLYGIASCLVHPAINEQWGLVINEACAAGLPLIISDKVGASEELLEDGINGFKFDPKSNYQISNSFIKIHNLSNKDLKKMGLKSVEKVEKLRPVEFGKSVLKIIQKVLKNEK